jgi:hypothetical protein
VNLPTLEAAHRLLDGDLVDAGVPDLHEAPVIKFPVLRATQSTPVSRKNTGSMGRNASCHWLSICQHTTLDAERGCVSYKHPPFAPEEFEVR